MSVSYPFVALPHQIARGGHGAINLAVLAVIMSHGRCFASIPTIAKEVGCSEKPVRKSIKYWRDNAKRLNMVFNFIDGGNKHSAHTIEVDFPVMFDPDKVNAHVVHSTQGLYKKSEGVVAKVPPGGSKSARGVVAKVPPQVDYGKRTHKKTTSTNLLSQEEQIALGFQLTC